MIKFVPRIYFGNMIFFYFFFSIFWFIGLIFLLGYFNDVGRVSVSFQVPGLSGAQTIGLIFIGFSSSVILIMLFMNLAVGSYYAVDDNGIIISRHGFKTRILFNNIADIRKIDCKEAQQIVAKLRREQLGINIGRIFGSSKEFIDFIKYCTVPITLEEVQFRIGRKTFIREMSMRLLPKVIRARISGNFIFLTINSGKQHLLSPKDVDRFLDVVEKHRYVRR